MAMGEAGKVTAEDTATMLGASDRLKILDLVEASLGGQAANALGIMRDLYAMGAAPDTVVQDVMDMVHGLSVLTVTDNTGLDTLPHAGMDKAKAMAAKLTMMQLQRAWQILMKGMVELHNAPNAQKTAEMIILRLIFAADMPDPADLLKKIKAEKQTQAIASEQNANGHDGGNQPQLRAIAGGGQAVMQTAPLENPKPYNQESPETLEAMIDLFERNREMMLADHLYRNIACITLKKGVFEFVPYEAAPPDFAGRVRSCLQDWTGEQWMVSVTRRQDGALSLAEKKHAAEQEQSEALLENSTVKSVLDVFPDAEIVKIYKLNKET
jgi:DNA polymerase-3 subunit gamma/tau